jgi:hypothetical protein
MAGIDMARPSPQLLPSMRYRFTRQRVPALAGTLLTDRSGTRAAAYQICASSSMRAAVAGGRDLELAVSPYLVPVGPEKELDDKL